MQQQIDLVIFDWDGTLIDSQANIVQCLQWMSRDLDLPQRTENELSNIIGLGLYEALSTLYPDSDPQDYPQMVDRYRYHFFSSDPSLPFPGAEDVLSHLSNNEKGKELIRAGPGRNKEEGSIRRRNGRYCQIGRIHDGILFCDRF